MARGVRVVLLVAGCLALVAGLLPSRDGSAHGLRLGPFSSPVFRYRGEATGSRPPPAAAEGGVRVESSWFSSTVVAAVRVVRWSAGLVALGAVLLLVALRSGPRRGTSP